MKKRKDEKKKTVQMLSLITQLGLVMIISIGLAVMAGMWLDERLGTNYWSAILFFVGAIAGGQGAYRLISQTFDDEKRKK